MENEKRALSWREFVESGFDGREYQFPDFEGTFAATIACKRWDRNKNLLVYLDFDDGRKIMTAFCGAQRPLVRWSSGRCAV